MGMWTGALFGGRPRGRSGVRGVFGLAGKGLKALVWRALRRVCWRAAFAGRAAVSVTAVSRDHDRTRIGSGCACVSQREVIVAGGDRDGDRPVGQVSCSGVVLPGVWLG